MNTDESPRAEVLEIKSNSQATLHALGHQDDSSVSRIKASTSRTQLTEADEMLRTKKLETKWRTAQSLRLRVISSTVLPKGKVINISALGADGSFRGAKDGRTYFGCRKRAEKGNKDSQILNDILIPASDPDLTERHRGRHFQIEYDPFRESYFIKDLGTGFGAFVKLDSQLYLRDNNLLHIGESFVVVNLLQSKEDQTPRLRLKLFGGPSTGEVFYFSSGEVAENRVRVGRHPMCEVPIEDGLISKVQLTIRYEGESGWVLVDGDLDHQRGSTNGTWVYLSDEYEVYNGMVFKVNSTLFQAMLWV